MIQHDTPNSSNISRILYDDQKAELVIEFRKGRPYRYSDVPPEIWNDFVAAPSAGKYFAQYIKGQYKYQQA